MWWVLLSLLAAAIPLYLRRKGVVSGMASSALMCVESVLVSEELGLQCTTRYGDGSATSVLLEWDQVKDILLLEGARRYSFVFFLAVRQANKPAPLTVLFPVPPR